jgi:hypothetical protein
MTLKLEYDLLLFQLDAKQISWWEYSRKVPRNCRPDIYNDYWTYLFNNKEKGKRYIKEAEWRMEARRKGILRE